MKIADKSIRKNHLSRSKQISLLSRLSRSSAYYVLMNDNKGEACPVRSVSMMVAMSHDDKRQQSFSPSSNIINNCRVCLQKRHSLYIACLWRASPTLHRKGNAVLRRFKVLSGQESRVSIVSLEVSGRKTALSDVVMNVEASVVAGTERTLPSLVKKYTIEHGKRWWLWGPKR